MSDNASPQPTRVRHTVVFMLVLSAVLLYLDRFCVGMAEPYIKQDLDLTTFQVSIFFSAFFLAYALFQVPSGWFGDRFGPRLMLTIYIITWSFFTAMMGLSYGFFMLLMMRTAYGIGQAGAYPTSANVLSKWVPFTNRGTASSLVAFGGRVGAAIAPSLTAVLIVLFVPLEVSSLFQPKSLRDGQALCLQLSPPGEIALSGPLDHVSRTLPEGVQKRITEIANEYRGGSVHSQLSEEDRRLLVQSLNTIVKSDDFYRERTFDELKNVEHVAITYVQRIEQGQALTQQETERMNRLLLESCFPEALGKVYVSGWRPVMITYGFLGLLVAALVFLVVRNRPEEHRLTNSTERALIAAGRPASAPGPHGSVGKVPWSRLLRSRSMWMHCFGQIGTNIGWVFLVTWFPRYLIENHQVPILERGLMASTPLFAGWLGMLGGGRLTDWLVGRVGLRWGRRIPWAFSRFIAMGAFLACPFLDTPWAITTALAVVAISTDLGVAPAWAFFQDVGGKYVGSILGWGNMWGNLGAAASPVLLAWVFTTWGWNEMFMVCAVGFLAAGSFALAIDATVPIAPTDKEDKP